MSEARILYIEDNPENRLLVKRILEAEGYIVEEAIDGFSGLEKASEVEPDLILLDINLPEIDGYDLAHRLREIPTLDQTPILALTANVMKGDRERTLEAGCDGYIQKPIDVDRLPDQIQNALQKVQ
jgi:two-component system cell cycle response regulator DivK